MTFSASPFTLSPVTEYYLYYLKRDNYLAHLHFQKVIHKLLCKGGGPSEEDDDHNGSDVATDNRMQ